MLVEERNQPHSSGNSSHRKADTIQTHVFGFIIWMQMLSTGVRDVHRVCLRQLEFLFQLLAFRILKRYNTFLRRTQTANHSWNSGPLPVGGESWNKSNLIYLPSVLRLHFRICITSHMQMNVLSILYGGFRAVAFVYSALDEHPFLRP